MFSLKILSGFRELRRRKQGDYERQTLPSQEPGWTSELGGRLKPCASRDYDFAIEESLSNSMEFNRKG